MNKILVVEDENDIREQICDLLETSGYTVESLHDGKQAIDYLEHDIPDLVISDIMMPNIDGYQLLEYFHRLPAASTVPFIFLSAKTDHMDVRNGMTSGADDYLMKPFRAKELLKSVEAQIKKKQKYDQKFEEIYTDISAYVPHELRTPLIPVLGYVELIRDSLNDLSKEEITDMVCKIDGSVHRLHKVIEKFIRYTEIQARITRKFSSMEILEPTVLAPSSIIEIISKKILNEAGRLNDIEIHAVDANLKLLESDFEFIVEEMVNNAVKFSNPGTKIIIKTEVKDDLYVIEVTDHGRGMTPEQITNINPFVQHDRKKFQQQGNGLGLVTIKKLTEHYDGGFNLTSIKNVFTTCKVALPIVYKY